jgi:lipopolysaccharide biosynthesis glycosyltransferase
MSPGSWNVLVCVESRFAIGAWITIWSAFHCSDRRLAFYLLTTQPASAQICKIQRLAATNRIPLTIVAADTKSISDLPTTAIYPMHVNLRLLAPGALPDLDHFLYLDSDILVRRSLLPLFANLSDDKVASGVPDYFFDDIGHGLKQTHDRLGLSPLAPYVNSGVLLINAQLWREQNITTRAIEYLQRYRDTISNPDQDALNAVLSGSLTKLDWSWNVQVGALQFFNRTGWPEERLPLKERQAELLSDGNIVHFIGPSKPWNDGLRMPYAKEYRQKIVSSGWIPRWWSGLWLVQWFYLACIHALRRRLRAL